MTIETIAYIASRKRNILNHLEREACANAISTMRKYQIIVNDLKACEQDSMEFINVSFLKEIIDGNVD